MGKKICAKCGLPLEKRQVSFLYLETRVTEEVECCPQCGQVYIPEEIAAGKITQVEKTLEEK